MDEVRERPGLELLELEAEHALPGRVQLDEVPVERRRADEVQRQLLLAGKELV